MLVASLLATGALLRSSPVRHASSVSRYASVHMSAYSFSARDLRTGKVRELSEFEGKVSLVVNVASK